MIGEGGRTLRYVGEVSGENPGRVGPRKMREMEEAVTLKMSSEEV